MRQRSWWLALAVCAFGVHCAPPNAVRVKLPLAPPPTTASELPVVQPPKLFPDAAVPTVAPQGPRLLGEGDPQGLATWWSSSQVYVGDLHEGTVASFQPTGNAPFRCVRLGPSGRMAITIDAADAATLWDARTGHVASSLETMRPPNGGAEICESVDWAADDSAVLLLGKTGRLILVDTRTGEQHHTEVRSTNAFAIHSGARLVGVILEENVFEVREMRTWALRLTLPGVESFAFDPSGRRIAVTQTANPSAGLSVWDVRTAGVHWRRKDLGYASWSNDGRYLAAAGNIDWEHGRTHLVDATNGYTQIEGIHPSGVWGIHGWSPSGSAYAITTGAGCVLWRGTVVQSLYSGADNRYTCGANWSPDGKSLMNEAGLWTVGRRTPIALRFDDLVAFAWRDDGRAFATTTRQATECETGGTDCPHKYLLQFRATSDGSILAAAEAGAVGVPRGQRDPFAMSWIKGTKVVALRRPDTDRFLQLQRLGDRTMLWVAPPATGKDNVLFAVSSSGLYDGRQEELTALQVAKHIPVPKSVLEKATRHPGLVRAFVAGEQLDR